MRKTSTLTIVTFRVVEETDDNDKQPPSLPPFPIDVEGVTLSETETVQARPLAKVFPLSRVARKVAG